MVRRTKEENKAHLVYSQHDSGAQHRRGVHFFRVIQVPSKLFERFAIPDGSRVTDILTAMDAAEEGRFERTLARILSRCQGSPFL